MKKNPPGLKVPKEEPETSEQSQVLQEFLEKRKLQIRVLKKILDQLPKDPSQSPSEMKESK